MSELSNWKKVSEVLVGAVSAVGVAMTGIVIESVRKKLMKNELNDVQAHLDSMGPIDKYVTHKADYKYLQSKKDRLSK